MYLQFIGNNKQSSRIPVAWDSAKDFEIRFVVSNLFWDYLYQFAGCDLLIGIEDTVTAKIPPAQYSIRQKHFDNYVQDINARADYFEATGHHGVCHSYLIIRYWEK